MSTSSILFNAQPRSLHHLSIETAVKLKAKLLKTWQVLIQKNLSFFNFLFSQRYDYFSSIKMM